MRATALCLSTFLWIGFSGAQAAVTELTTDDQKTLYAIGVAISQSLNDFALSEAELDVVKAGLSDGVLKLSLIHI